MASDISSIIQNELINTLDSLLSLQSSIDGILKFKVDNSDKTQYVKVVTELSFNEQISGLIFYLPTATATKFEYFMLGGIGDVKEVIDDEIVDAIKEIIATIGGGLSTTINAQGFDDISSFSSLLKDATIAETEDLNEENIYEFKIKLNEDSFNFYISFDSVLLPFLNNITLGNKAEVQSDDSNVQSLTVNPNLDALLSILGENASDNLKLLFDVKLKFSVRLGTKTFLLKDIVNWDVGEIIELEQMVNEPLDILINNIKVGVGEAVIVEGKFGIKVKYIGEEN